MGTVFLGLHPDGRKVAVKVVRAEYVADTDIRNRFRSEVNRARQVPSFSTAEVLDADPDHNPPYLVVEYVDGPSLAEVVQQEGIFSQAALHSVAVGIAAALTAIHGAGVVHRDLKPQNVLLSRDGPKVIDFGIARPFEMTSQHTRTHQMVGTISYMAPERFADNASHHVTPAMDIFAWGVLVTYAGTGRTPFAADSAPATAVRIMTRPPDLGQLPEPLRSIVERTLAKEPSARPDAHELLSMLLSGEFQPTRPMALPRPEPAANPPRRPRRRLAIGAAVLGVLGVAVLMSQLGLGDRTGAAPAADGPTNSTPEPTGKPALATGVFGGERQTLIHIVEAKGELGFGDSGRWQVAAAEQDGLDLVGAPEQMFALVPYGNKHLVRAVRPAGGKDPGCLAVDAPDLDTSTVSVRACTPGPATLFTLIPTGRKDGGEATFLISNQDGGELQWSTANKELYVRPVGTGPITTTFTFLDQGPLR